MLLILINNHSVRLAGLEPTGHKDVQVNQKLLISLLWWLGSVTKVCLPGCRRAAAVVEEVSGAAWLASWRAGGDWQEDEDSRKMELRLPPLSSHAGEEPHPHQQNRPAAQVQTALQLLDLRCLRPHDVLTKF